MTWNIAKTGSPWTHPGGDGLGTTGAQGTNPFTHWTGNGTTTGSWFEFDATSLVTGALDGSFTNNGILMVGDATNTFAYVSREGHVPFGSVNAANIPQLVITTAPEPTPLIGVVLGISALAFTRRRRSH